MNTVMPPKIRLGDHMQSTVLNAIHNWENARDYGTGLRQIMGYQLPTWQRPLVWTHEQIVSFIESLWLGLPVGTYSFNQVHEPQFDGLLIDGQQRMYAIQCYLENRFSVFGHKWSEVTDADRRRFSFGTHFPCYITKTTDEEYLRSYYDLMNFSGTAHTEDQRAIGTGGG